MLAEAAAGAVGFSAVIAALALGLQTSISPCPLATNIAAVSFIGRRVGQPRLVIATGLLYMLGRMSVYTALGWLLTASLLAATVVSRDLQHYMNLLMGPLLIIIGMFLLELLGTRWMGAGVSEVWQQRAERLGLWGALVLGVIFALAFCPVSAALFFVGLMTLSIQQQSPFLLPALFGIGTALPAVAIAIVLAVSTKAVGVVYNNLRSVEWWTRRVTGVVFVLAGIYLTLHYIYGCI